MNTPVPVIHIIGGRGHMGQWLVRLFNQHGISANISGRNDMSDNSIKQADIIIISVPIEEIKNVVEKIKPLVGKTSLVADITSLKVIPMETMKTLSCGTLGMHPLFGPTLNSLQGQTIIFCSQKENAWIAWLQKFFEKEKMQVTTMTPEQHDKAMALIQSLTHAANIILAKTMFTHKSMLGEKLQTPNSVIQTLVMGRVLQQDPGLLADMEINNPFFSQVLKTFTENASSLLKIIDEKNKKEFLDFISKEHKLSQKVSNFSTERTNKIIQLLSDVPVAFSSHHSRIRKLQNSSIAYLGPKGTYSEKAALLLSGKNILPQITISDVFEQVWTEHAGIGIVPAENSLEGTVRETLDLLAEFPVYIIGSLDIPIHHQLLSFETDIHSIKKIYSHPQALAQCKKWLKATIPWAISIPAQSTTESLQRVEKGTGYIASKDAAKAFSVPVLIGNIGDNPHNTTKFYVISKSTGEIAGAKNNKTFLFFTVLNRAGVLRDILDVFAKEYINLTKIESRPSRGKPWDYDFFAEIDIQEKTLLDKKILDKIKRYCNTIRIVGQT